MTISKPRSVCNPKIECRYSHLQRRNCPPEVRARRERLQLPLCRLEALNADKLGYIDLVADLCALDVSRSRVLELAGFFDGQFLEVGPLSHARLRPACVGGAESSQSVVL